MATKPILARTFRVRIAYLSGDHNFAIVTTDIEILDDVTPDAAARAAAEDHPYHDPRVPDLSYRLSITPLDPEDPGPPTTSVKPICPHCGAEDLVRDATVRWDVESQSWSLSGIFDCTSCDVCDAESDTLAVWVPASHVASTEIYIAEVRRLVGDPDPLADPVFRFFCLSRFIEFPAVEAAEAWKKHVRPAP